MLVANKKRKQKTVSEILQAANKKIQSYKGTYYWGERIYWILQHVWDTAFNRGYEKALRDMAKEDLSASAEVMLLKRRKT